MEASAVAVRHAGSRSVEVAAALVLELSGSGRRREGDSGRGVTGFVEGLGKQGSPSGGWVGCQVLAGLGVEPSQVFLGGH